MNRMVMAGSVLCGALVLTGGAQLSSTQGPQTPEALLGAAIHQEEAEGNLEAAIESYKKFLAQYGDNRPLAVQALLRMGQAYERLGRPDARDAYERVLRDYADQAEYAAETRARLAELSALTRSGDATPRSELVMRQVWAGPEVDILGAPSPDGRYLSFVDWTTGDLAVRDLATGETRHLTNKGSWMGSTAYAERSTVSPDSKQVAYTWFGDDFSHDLRIVGLDGSEPRVIYRNEEVDVVEPAAWSPDGPALHASG